jgi:arsenite methyltransferase
MRRICAAARCNGCAARARPRKSRAAAKGRAGRISSAPRAHRWLECCTAKRDVCAMRGPNDPIPMDPAVEAGCSPLSRSALIDLAALRRGNMVVALGCGDCRDGARVASLVAPAGRVILVVPGAELLPHQDLRARAEPWPLAVRGDLAATGLRASLADVVLSNCAMCGRRDKPAIYREIHRILKPGGRLVMSDVVGFRATPRGAFGAPPALALRAIPESEYLAAVRAAGFDRVTLLQRTAPYEEGGGIVLSLTLQATRG